MTANRPARRKSATNREYPRTARLNQLLRQIIGDELERIDDERLELLTVTSVDAEKDMRRATIYYDSLGGVATDGETLEALGELRPRLQSAVARQARTKNTPELLFAPDPAVRAGARIDEILRDIEPVPQTGEPTDPEFLASISGDLESTDLPPVEDVADDSEPDHSSEMDG